MICQHCFPCGRNSAWTSALSLSPLAIPSPCLAHPRPPPSPCSLPADLLLLQAGGQVADHVVVAGGEGALDELLLAVAVSRQRGGDVGGGVARQLGHHIVGSQVRQPARRDTCPRQPLCARSILSVVVVECLGPNVCPLGAPLAQVPDTWPRHPTPIVEALGGQPDLHIIAVVALASPLHPLNSRVGDAGDQVGTLRLRLLLTLGGRLACFPHYRIDL